MKLSRPPWSYLPWLCVGLLGLLTPWALAEAGDQEEECFSCHGDPELALRRQSGFQPSLAEERLAYQGSAHAGLTCAECHPDIREVPHPRPAQRPDCVRCHQTPAMPAYADSVHGRAVARGDPDAPRCVDCHAGGRDTPRGHDIRPRTDPKSAIFRTNIPHTCARCHADEELLNNHGIPLDHTARSYLSSVHGAAVARGNQKAATCIDCHGAHDAAATEPEARVSRHHVPETCGGCHPRIYEQYRRSIHAQAEAQGIEEAPVCTSCHGEHTIRQPEDPESSVYPTHVSATCSQCHADEALNRRYGLPAARLETYRESYHGVASRYGNLRVANCATCHGAHDILPSSDPRSSINPANIPSTCGQCHEGATSHFAQGTIHLEITPEGSRPVFLVTAFFKWLTLSVMVALIGHIVLDLWSNLRARRRQGPAGAPPNPGDHHDLPPDGSREERTFRRFSYTVLLQHAVMFVSVLLLIVTGLPLKFPDSWLTQRVFGLALGMQLSGFLHRVGAIGLIGVAIFHTGYLVLSADGRHNLKHLLPKVKDVTDVVRNVLYFFGLRERGARFGRFSYMEKFDYWAVYWGCVVMIGSGAVLWFFTLALRFLPKTAVDIAHAAHSEEALLATLAITIWHFYNVHFCPQHFPINWLWNDGTLTESQLKHHHPVEYEQITGKPADR
ncbi:MAG: hypothetical protein ACE5R4_05605 [Armatimonadota bacterium]